MELGVDISALNVVHMRNVPPTPANYAQRSGRAGPQRAGRPRPDLRSSQSPHDQYFFRDPRAMVHGEVKAPLLDLANRDLVDSHLQAVWLSCVEEPLDASIAELLVLADPPRPLREDLSSAMREERVAVPPSNASGACSTSSPTSSRQRTLPGTPGATLRRVGRGQRARSLQQGLRPLARPLRRRGGAARRRPPHDGRLRRSLSAEKRAAQGRHAQAIDQLNLLQRGTNSLSSDFYTYRYLATEGFLPGYNFPRLPLMAYVPAPATDGASRPTSNARASSPSPSSGRTASSTTRAARIASCARCSRSASATPRRPTCSCRRSPSEASASAAAPGTSTTMTSVCHACGASLGTAEIVNNVYRIENVATQPAERITANDEERQRQGFDLQTTFEWAFGTTSSTCASATVIRRRRRDRPPGLRPGATITRLNKGLRRRADKKTLGFKIDPVSGYWAKNDETRTTRTRPRRPRQWIVPSVQDHKNALLFTPLDASRCPETSVTTLQHALLRGIEAVFQLEEGEILAEPMPTRDERNGFLSTRRPRAARACSPASSPSPASLAAGRAARPCRSCTSTIADERLAAERSERSSSTSPARPASRPATAA
jgi:hypothetical protein